MFEIIDDKTIAFIEGMHFEYEGIHAFFVIEGPTEGMKFFYPDGGYIGTIYLDTQTIDEKDYSPNMKDCKAYNENIFNKCLAVATGFKNSIAIAEYRRKLKELEFYQ